GARMVEAERISGPETGRVRDVREAPDGSIWFMSVSNPQGQMVYDELASASKALVASDIKVGPQTFKGKQLSIKNPVKGQWTVKLTHKGNSASLVANPAAQQGKSGKDIAAYLLHKGDSEFQLYSYLDNNFTTVNNDINMVAYMVDSTLGRGERQQMVRKEAVSGTIDRAIATIKSPSGEVFTVRLNDNGVNGDKVANDGQFGGKIPTNEAGVYTNQLQIQGTRPDGKPFSRTTTDIYPVAPVSFEFADRPALVKFVSSTSAVLSVPVKNLDNSDSVFMAAEIWGTNADGELESAAWVGGIVAPKNSNKNTMMDLSFDTRWLTRSNLKAPFTLKSLRMQTVDGNVPIAQRDEMNTRSMLPKQLFESTNAVDVDRTITRDMLMGKAPEHKGETVANAGSGTKLLLVHGYCSGQAWNTGHFSDATEFQDYHKSISHNAFAQKVINFGAAYNSYGIVAHSQGGAASLEMYTKYWTGLDNATGGRIIQSVGTPYQGTALAGNLAAIGDVFGNAITTESYNILIGFQIPAVATDAARTIIGQRGLQDVIDPP
ncbi:MAG: PQQ-dependent sugar dehydrogenase, partial [Psychrosphaera sp.]|nr:PQQ-dependent sugar dehydrogenase [Psychrosphaera sp.]